MAINKNHEFEDLNGVKCAIVEKNVSKERVDFLKQILEYNNYSVIVVPTPAAKVPPAKATIGLTPGADESAHDNSVPTAPSLPETFTVGVTDVMFNPTNAIFGRSLKARGNHIVTLAYWQQKEKEPHEEIPYFEKHPDN